MTNNKIFDKYELAYNKLKSIFEFIYEEYSISDEVNPIEHIKYRIKKQNSIEGKLNKKGVEVTEENIDNLLFDIVGVRIVCSFLSDLEYLKTIIRRLADNGVLEIIEEVDYVKNPKGSGYSSYHIVVKVPVNYDGCVKYVSSEIQIRTIAMDMSASLEYKACYKKQGYTDDLKTMMLGAYKFCRKVDQDLDMVVKSVDSSKKNKLALSYPFMSSEEFNLEKLRYGSALNLVREKFDKLYKSYDQSGMINPIEHMKYRIKSDDEIIRKLISKDKYVDMNNVLKYVNDLAGVRIVCSFISEMDELKEFIRNDMDLKILDEKDYITNPKNSGYRGYHFLVGVPVYTKDGVKYVKVEIQIRTIAMEMWASLEEKICYHKNPSEEVSSELKRLSSVISVLDNQIDSIYMESRRQQENKDVKKRELVLKR